MNSDSIFLVFIGILISNILYESGIITKIYTKIIKIEHKIKELENKI